jgi:hypothetical protein
VQSGGSGEGQMRTPKLKIASSNHTRLEAG